MGRSDLERLSPEELIELVLRLQRPDIRTVVDTARLTGATPFGTIIKIVGA